MNYLIETPTVAVLLAAYNGVQWIEEQISSILNQQGVDVTLFVSVDLSTDGTDQWVQELASKSSNVIMLPYGERFGGAGANFFRTISDVNFGDYDFASFADQDDVWYPDKLNRACGALNSGQADVYSSNVTAFWSNGCEELIDKAQPKLHLDHFFEAAGPGCTYVFKQEVMLQLQAFVRTLPDHVKKEVLHDWLSYAFCRERGYRWYIDPISSVRYRQHADNVVGTNNNWVAYKKRFALIRTKSYRKRVESLVGTVAPQRLADVSSRFFLLKNIRQLRRRTRDRYFLLFILLLGIY